MSASGHIQRTQSLFRISFALYRHENILYAVEQTGQRKRRTRRELKNARVHTDIILHQKVKVNERILCVFYETIGLFRFILM